MRFNWLPLCEIGSRRMVSCRPLQVNIKSNICYCSVNFCAIAYGEEKKGNICLLQQKGTMQPSRI